MQQPVSLKIGEQIIQVPGLSFDEMERFDLAETFSKIPLNGGAYPNSKEFRAAALDVVHAAVRQDHPDVTREEVSRALTSQNLEPVIRWVLALPAEADKGEAKRP